MGGEVEVIAQIKQESKNVRGLRILEITMDDGGLRTREESEARGRLENQENWRGRW